MVLSNLSDGPCETKDVIVENEVMIRKLADLLVCEKYNLWECFILHVMFAMLFHYSNTHTPVYRYSLHASVL